MPRTRLDWGVLAFVVFAVLVSAWITR